MHRLRKLQELGQSVWFDYIERNMLDSGELARLVAEDGLRGVTSNPAIFEKAITGSHAYDASLRQAMEAHSDWDSRALFYALAIEDIQAGADVLLPVYQESGRRDGMISLEVSPDLAYDTEGTIAEARRLWHRVNRPNLMIKVPATAEGLPAVETLIGEGINVNVTLLFSVVRYEEVVEAYLRGLEARHRLGQPLEGVASVASFFVSRVDSLIDTALKVRLKDAEATERSALAQLLGTTAIANAKVAYQSYKSLFSTARFEVLAAAGAHTQRLLWASTGTKDEHYSDVLYVDSLIGPDTVNTMPPATYKAFLDHGNPRSSIEEGITSAKEQLAQLQSLGLDLNAATNELETHGVTLFADAFNRVLQAISVKASAIIAVGASV